MAVCERGTTAYGSHKGICSDNSVFSVADAAWATATFGSGHMLCIQNDGNLVMYRPGFGAVWATGTCCR